MREITAGEYRLVFTDETYALDDGIDTYDFQYIENSIYKHSSSIGIKVYKNEAFFKSAVIGAAGGSTTIHETSFVYDPDRIVICCSDTVFCLSIPYLSLLWKTRSDSTTCFEVFKYKTDYIIHGELEITRLGHDGEIIWQQSGADVFTSLNSKNDDFIITETYILVTDWNNKKYKFDFDGDILQ